MFWNDKKILWGLIFFSAAFLLLNLAFASNKLAQNGLVVSFLDVGQGDATLIDYFGQHQILIDGGPNGKKLLAEVGKILGSDKKIDVVILTHPDKDHYFGLIDLLDNYEVGLFLYNGSWPENDALKALEEKIQKRKIRKQKVISGNLIELGNFFKMKVLNPDFWINGNDQEKNSQSVAVRLDFGKNSFLLAGDAEQETEWDMIEDGDEIDVDWLKVSHHGSKNSSSQKFLELVSPYYAVISSGKNNSYGHPAEETLNRIKSVGAEIFRTDQLGTVNVLCPAPEKDCQKVN